MSPRERCWAAAGGRIMGTMFRFGVLASIIAAAVSLNFLSHPGVLTVALAVCFNVGLICFLGASRHSRGTRHAAEVTGKAAA